MGSFDISIIVPVYNVKELLPMCIESLVTQSCKSCEIILVDDGSTDGSSELCDEYEKKFANIQCIHQQNGGLSAARNTGLRNANGKYILFVDSDDYIEEETCDVFLKLANRYNCEIVSGDEYKVFGDEKKNGYTRGIEKNKVFSGKEFLLESLKTKHISMCAPFSMYKRSMILENHLYFKEGILHEDEWWTPQVTLTANKVVYSGLRFYYHRYREGSITHNTNKSKNSKDLIETCYDLFKIYEKLEKPLSIYLLDYLCMLFLSAVYIGNNIRADKLFPIKTAHSFKNRIKSALYFVSPRIYLRVNKMSKRK